MSQQEQLENIAHEIIENKVCPELAASARALVPGEGNPDAAIMMVGEAPGAQEDLQGRPFVGASGKFLTEMLTEIGIDRQDVFITSVLKYRPPKNRDPRPDEVAAFIPYLYKQIDIIEPKVIVTLGRYALNVFLPGAKIGEVHGVMQEANGRRILPLYHPAAALYNGSMRVTLKEDFARIPDILAAL